MKNIYIGIVNRFYASAIVFFARRHRDGIRLRPSRRATMILSHDGGVEFSLANVTERDAGVYSCTATNTVGQADTFARVAVIAAATRDRSPIGGSPGVMGASPDIP